MQRLPWVLILTIGIISFGSQCDCEEDTDEYNVNYEIVSNEKVAKGLEFPSGLSKSKNAYLKSSSKEEADELMGIVVSGPVFQNLDGVKGLQRYENPKVMRISEKQSKSSTDIKDELILTTLSEVDLEKYISDFDAVKYYPISFTENLCRPQGLTLDGLILKDGTILTSSNSSDKLFETDELGKVEIFMQDEKLERITDIIQGKDEKIYAVTAQKIDDEDSLLVLSPKRVISISPETKLISTELELPSSFDLNNFYNEYPGLWKEAPFIEKLKIIENSDVGKKRFGTKFYISDMLKRCIYKADEANNLEILVKDLHYPHLIGVDSVGNIIYATSPFWLSEGLTDQLRCPTEIHALDPETGKSKSIYKFSETPEDYMSKAGTMCVKIPNHIQFYSMPTGFNITNIFKESETSLELIISNSHQGTLHKLIFNKEISEK